MRLIDTISIFTFADLFRAFRYIAVCGIFLSIHGLRGEVLRSGAEPDYPPFSFVNEQGEAAGYAVELLKAALEQVGLEARFEIAEWKELKQKLADGEVDVLPLVGRTPEREALYDFTIPYLTLSGAIFVKDDQTGIIDWTDLADKRVGVMAGDNSEEYVLRNRVTELPVAFPTYREAFLALHRGEIDAVVAQKMMGVMLIRDLGLSDIRVVGRPNREYEQKFCFAVPKGQTDLLKRLNEGLAMCMDQGIQRMLVLRWLRHGERAAALSRVVIYGGDANYPPYEYLDGKGRPTGFNIDLARAVARQVGVDISFSLGKWDEVREHIQGGEYDLSSMLYSESRARHVEFGITHTRVQLGAFGRKEFARIESLDQLADARVAVQAGDIMHDILVEKGLEEHLHVVDSLEEGLRMVAENRVDVMLGQQHPSMELITRNRLTGVFPIPKLGSSYDYAFAVMPENQILIDLWNEGVLDVKDSGEYRELHNQWLGILDPNARWAKIGEWMAVLLSVLTLLGVLVAALIQYLRKQVRDRTRELEESYRLLQRTQYAIDHFMDTVCWIGRDGHFIYFNQNAGTALGYTPEDFMPLRVTDVLVPMDLRQWEELWGEVSAKGSLTFESEAWHRDGTLIPVEIHASFLNLGGEDCVFILVQDIRTRKAAEAERNRLVAAIEQTHDTVVITDTAGKILYVNPAFTESSGYSRKEAVGRNPRVLKSGRHPDSFYREMWEQLLAGRVWRGTIFNRRKNGEIYEEETTISPIKDGNGTILNYVAVKRDVTGQRELETQLWQAQKMESVGRLAGGVAHDFNNLLTGIMGQTEFCKLSIPGDHELQNRLDDILDAVTRSADITRQLMAFARKQTVSPKILDLNQAVSGSLKLLQRLIGENITLRFEPGSDLPAIRIDPGQIDQILTNLCVNARDAIADIGDITLVTSREAPGPDETLPRVCLRVCDTGHGMDAETREKLFEPFFTTKEMGRGTGLGLATVYGIVMQNRGGIEVDSTPGNGSCFRLWFPGVEKAGTNGAAETDTPPPSGDADILLVDDEPFICESVKYGLQALGYRVVTATSTDEALRLSESPECHFDLLITDVIMPVMNGKDLSLELTRRFPDLKTLFISGFPADIVAKQGVLDPDVHLLAKPFSQEQIALVLHEMLAVE